MLAKIIANEIACETAASAKRHDNRNIVLSAEHALAFAKDIAARILSEMQFCGSHQVLTALSVNLDRVQGTLQIDEIRKERYCVGFHG